MKKILILSIALVWGMVAFAQEGQGFGLSAGGGMIMAKQKSSTSIAGQKTTSTDSGVGFYFNAGLSSDLGLGGLGYTMDLFFDHWFLSPDEGDGDATVRENYLGYALALDITFNASETLALRPFFGPGFSYGLSSKTKWTNPVSKQEETMNNYDKDSKYQRLYSYLTIGADVLIKPAHLRLRGAVDFGMWDRYSSVKEITTKDGPNFRLGIAYLF